ncbi:MAG TPA: MarR family transcriptional regulator [Phototrophicaceae bacterium]|jgi:DNA-binding MarR family transcriptional regulator|nr:MarR family transcriptional regulator [Phototrophicaceae bacterium]
MNDTLDLNDTLPAQLVNIGKRIAQLLDERLVAVGLSGARLLALQSIVTATDEVTIPVTVTCLADNMNTTKSNVTAMIDRLIDDGLVTRDRSLEDRRTVVIALTDEGQRRYEAGAAVVRKFHADLNAALSAEEKQLLHCLMDKLPQ